MFFVSEGVVEVLADDEIKLIRFLSKGSYFGEIGVLLEPHTRSCSIVARTTTMLYYVKAENLVQGMTQDATNQDITIRDKNLVAILNEFPEQQKQLKDVAV